MAKNKLTDLRNHLFETIEGLMDEEKPMDVKRATAVANVAQAIIGSAKLEIQYLKMRGQEQEGSAFLEAEAREVRAALPQATPTRKGLSTGRELGTVPRPA